MYQTSLLVSLTTLYIDEIGTALQNANDNRKKGGVAIYLRNNLRVSKVTKSDRYECIFLEIELPSKYM